MTTIKHTLCFIASDGITVTEDDQGMVHLIPARGEGTLCDPSAKFSLGISMMFAGKKVCPTCYEARDY